MTSPNEILGLKNINEYNKKAWGEIVGFYFKSAWCFNKLYEKLILLVLSFMGMWKIYEVLIK